MRTPLSVGIIDNLPEEVVSLVKVISDTIRGVSEKVSTFVVGDVVVNVAPLMSGATNIIIYDFNRTCMPAAQLRSTRRDVQTYEMRTGSGSEHIELAVILEALRAVPEMIQDRMPRH